MRLSSPQANHRAVYKNVAGLTSAALRVLTVLAVLLLVYALRTGGPAGLESADVHSAAAGEGEGANVRVGPGADFGFECGNWQSWYTELHRKTVSGELPPRFLVSTGVESGLADRLTGTISGFFFALLTGRAFQISTFDPIPGLELAFDPSRSAINWYRPPIDEDIVGPMIFTRMSRYNMTRKMETHVPEERYRKEWAYFFQINPDPPDVHTEFGEMDLNLQPKGQHEAQNIVFASNRGQTVALFGNPHHRTQLEEMGLTRLTAFTCAWDYLFVPVPAVTKAVAGWRQKMDTPGLVKLGIQVRLGDGEMMNSEAKDDPEAYLLKAQDFFACAEALEQRFNPDQRPVVWFLISDSLQLRRAASEKYKDRVLTDTITAPMHVDCSDGPQIKNPCRDKPELRAPAVQAAVTDILAFRHTNVHIVTDTSGFGRIGAWLASPKKNIHTLALDPEAVGAGNSKHWHRDCSVVGPDSIEELGYSWSSF